MQKSPSNFGNLPSVKDCFQENDLEKWKQGFEGKPYFPEKKIEKIENTLNNTI